MVPLVEQIKEKYPNPTHLWEDDTEITGTYCVLGACFLFLGYDKKYPDWKEIHFPDWERAGHILKEINPALTKERAYLVARVIAGASDEGEYGEAWEVLNSALSFVGN